MQFFSTAFFQKGKLLFVSGGWELRPARDARNTTSDFFVKRFFQNISTSFLKKSGCAPECN